MKSIFKNTDNALLLEIAQAYDTPTYVYDAAQIRANFKRYQQAFEKNQRKHTVCYAVKACSNLAILQMLAEMGAGFDIVSVGELKRVLMAGGEADQVIFSGVGKTVEEMAFALEVGIHAFDIESIAELETLIKVAKAMEMVAPISIRFNPNVDAKTHPYISTGLKENKFGLDTENARYAYRIAHNSPHIKVLGINMHIGSQISSLEVFKEALLIQKAFVDSLQTELGIKLEHINMGGGAGVIYKTEDKAMDIEALITMACEIFADKQQTLVVEPGRSIVANAGALLTRVLYQKQQADNRFSIVDAAMNDYIRSALYQAYNHIVNVTDANRPLHQETIVGPVCESGDVFTKKREIGLKTDDIIAICDTGAYGMTMASNYNTRSRAAEVLIEDGDFHLIRRRETFEDLITPELVGNFMLEEDDEV